MATYNSILDTIGNTPMIKLQRLAPEGVNLYAKVEAFNPMGSVKDRIARAIIENAEATGELQPGQTVIEATSGNTGIALAMVCAQKGYPLIIVMAENFSVERRKLMRFLGARVVLTPAADKGTGMLQKAVELATQHGYFLCRQFDNEMNADIHTRTTAREILDDIQGQPLHYWVSGFGTGGTLTGVAREFNRASPDTKIIAAEPDNSPVLGGGIPQPRDEAGAPMGSHPAFRPHLMQGWAPDFISGLTQDAIDENLIDSIIPVDGRASLARARELATQEGILAGISSGATLVAAIEIAQTAEPGTNIVCMLPDTGERYMSTPLFQDIKEEMSEFEVALSQSTPGYQFFPAAAPPAPVSTPKAKVDEEAHSFVENSISHHSVVVFALEWCEFCWSVRKFFDALGINYQSIDVDSVAFQEKDRGGKIRQYLQAKLDVPTIPQIFVGGVHIGGATDLFEAWQSGNLQKLLQDQQISYDETVTPDIQALLPQWLHPRKSA